MELRVANLLDTDPVAAVRLIGFDIQKHRD
jgi:hypothetical protein